MVIDNNKVVEALRNVRDPNSGLDIIASRLVENLKIQGEDISFTVHLKSNDPQLKSTLNFSCMEEINKVYPEARVHIHLQTQANPEAKNEGVLPQVQNIIAVGSGKGGVGKSTVAVNLAIALRKKGARVGLIDADLYGPSIPTMMGFQGQRPKVEMVYNRHKIVPLQSAGIHVISLGVIVEPEQAVVLRGPRLGGIIKQFIEDCLWPELDYLIIDLPPGTGDIQLTLVQTVPLTGAIMVTTPQQIALIDAVKAMNMFLLPNVNVPVIGVIENMAWFTPEELPDNKYFLFGKGGGAALAKKGNTMLLGQVPIVQSVREGGDNGLPVTLHNDHPVSGIFDQIANKVVQQVNIRNEMMAPTRIVHIKT
ncbi:MAG TPA: Mrp/NBP35 family ATP-binding protein [Saprospiraceae bacterium]|nr:Mrp/NBP35 family ATP-binding protein [Saprospiraceae bacterium]